jgi:ABC-type polysaccharide/polyol phosphate transport system ATPase subunit
MSPAPTGAPAVVARDVTVRFRPYLDRRPTFRRSVAQLARRKTAEVVALDAVSFEVMRGEVFGIIGRNGAGKSTLMRVLAKTLKPNEGGVELRGRTSTLLQLGVGFNQELSGRRNVYLGGLAAGLRKALIDDRFDSIVEFAELEEAIDRPLKTYSSGMFARLAFSIGMHLDPDILLLDEVLAVGDQSFREKSLKAMQELVDRAGTIVLVSHNLPMVSSFCDRAMWLHRGQVRKIGSGRQTVRSYRDSERGRENRARIQLQRKGGVSGSDAVSPDAETASDRLERPAS